MAYQAGFQILLVIVAVVITYTFTQPKFTEISEMQDQRVAYQDAIAKTEQYNALLQQRLNDIASFSRSDITALNTFMPTTIDPAAVADDLTSIIERNGLLLQSISFGDVGTITVLTGDTLDLTTSDEPLAGGGSIEAEARRALVTQRFTVTVLGSYEALQGMLQDMERNAYPLQVATFQFTSDPESILNVYQFEIDSFAFDPNQALAQTN
jgi:hypothetical protein